MPVDEGRKLATVDGQQRYYRLVTHAILNALLILCRAWQESILDCLHHTNVLGCSIEWLRPHHQNSLSSMHLCSCLILDDAEAVVPNDNSWKKLQSLCAQLRKACNHPFLFPAAEVTALYNIALHHIARRNRM